METENILNKLAEAKIEKNKKRAFAQARQMVRKKCAEQKGISYDEMTDAQKLVVENFISNKSQMVSELAARILPRIVVDNTAINQKFRALTEELPPVPSAVTPEDIKKIKFKEKDGQRKKPPLKIYGKFEEALEKKAVKHDVDIDILHEVFSRGIEAWDPSSSQNQQQFAFARVNSFLNKGKTYYGDDKDLTESIDESFKKGQFVKLTNTDISKGEPSSGTIHSVSDSMIYVKNGSRIWKAKPEHVRDMKQHLSSYPKRVDNIHEISSNKLSHYVYHGNKSYDDLNNKSDEAYKSGDFKTGTKLVNKADRRARYLMKAEKRVNETVVSIDELSKDKAHEYFDKAAQNRSKADKENDQKTLNKRDKGLKRAFKVMVSEEVLEENLTTERDTKTPGVHHVFWKGKKLNAKIVYGSSGKIGKEGSSKSYGVHFGEKYVLVGSLDNAKKLIINKIKHQHGEYVRESNNTPYVKPFVDQSGAQAGWKSSNKHGKVKFWRVEAKQAALKHAGITEDVRAGDKQPIVVPAHYSASHKLIPAKTIMRKTQKKIINSGNVHDGKDNDGEDDNG